MWSCAVSYGENDIIIMQEWRCSESNWMIPNRQTTAHCRQKPQSMFGNTGTLTLLLPCSVILLGFFFLMTKPDSSGLNIFQNSNSASVLSKGNMIRWIQELEQKSSFLKSQMLIASPSSKYSEKTIFDPYEPHWNCPFERRVGKLFDDGGKFVCGLPNFFTSKNCLVYSIGSNADFSFESDFKQNYNQFCEIHTFDPTGDLNLSRKLAAQAGVDFHPWGLSSKNSGNNMLTLNTIMSKLGHNNRRIDILKVDCEGCEYDAFESIFQAISLGQVNVGQIQVELHIEKKPKIVTFFQSALKANFDIFHKERNHWGCAGHLCVEFSLIHADTKARVIKSIFVE
jgi:hypothetical protein